MPVSELEPVQSRRTPRPATPPPKPPAQAHGPLPGNGARPSGDRVDAPHAATVERCQAAADRPQPHEHVQAVAGWVHPAPQEGERPSPAAEVEKPAGDEERPTKTVEQPAVAEGPKTDAVAEAPKSTKTDADAKAAFEQAISRVSDPARKSRLENMAGAASVQSMSPEQRIALAQNVADSTKTGFDDLQTTIGSEGYQKADAGGRGRMLADWTQKSEQQRHWTQGDRDNLDKALGDKDGKFESDPISKWRQGPDGNCGSIAVIKGGMATYGSKVFDQVKPSGDGGYDVKMKDGQSVSLSAAEMDRAKRGAEFQGDDSPEKAYATLAFAAMAKRGEAEGVGQKPTGDSFQNTIDKLDTGMHVRDTARLLGLKDKVAPFDQSASVIMHESWAHAVFAQKMPTGQWEQDRWGERVAYDRTDGIGNTDTKRGPEWHVLRDCITFKPDVLRTIVTQAK